MNFSPAERELQDEATEWDVNQERFAGEGDDSAAIADDLAMEREEEFARREEELARTYPIVYPVGAEEDAAEKRRD